MEPTTDLKDKLTDAAHSLGEDATTAAKSAQTKAKEAWECAQEETQRAIRLSSLYARQHPLSTALVAVGVGVAIGLLINRSREPLSLTDRYINEPLHQSKGLLLSLLVAGSAILKRTLASATCAASELAEDVNGALKPVKKAVQNAVK
jgi:ElaB/YqjD/DUF883 family membrane-anchored ribosome-binding protein